MLRGSSRHDGIPNSRQAARDRDRQRERERQERAQMLPSDEKEFSASAQDLFHAPVKVKPSVEDRTTVEILHSLGNFATVRHLMVDSPNGRRLLGVDQSATNILSINKGAPSQRPPSSATNTLNSSNPRISNSNLNSNSQINPPPPNKVAPPQIQSQNFHPSHNQHKNQLSHNLPQHSSSSSSTHSSSYHHSSSTKLSTNKNSRGSSGGSASSGSKSSQYNNKLSTSSSSNYLNNNNNNNSSSSIVGGGGGGGTVPSSALSGAEVADQQQIVNIKTERHSASSKDKLLSNSSSSVPDLNLSSINQSINQNNSSGNSGQNNNNNINILSNNSFSAVSLKEESSQKTNSNLNNNNNNLPSLPPLSNDFLLTPDSKPSLEREDSQHELESILKEMMEIDPPLTAIQTPVQETSSSAAINSIISKTDLERQSSKEELNPLQIVQISGMSNIPSPLPPIDSPMESSDSSSSYSSDSDSDSSSGSSVKRKETILSEITPIINSPTDQKWNLSAFLQTKQSNDTYKGTPDSSGLTEQKTQQRETSSPKWTTNLTKPDSQESTGIGIGSSDGGGGSGGKNSTTTTTLGNSSNSNSNTTTNILIANKSTSSSTANTSSNKKSTSSATSAATTSSSNRVSAKDNSRKSNNSLSASISTSSIISLSSSNNNSSSQSNKNNNNNNNSSSSAAVHNGNIDSSNNTSSGRETKNSRQSSSANNKNSGSIIPPPLPSSSSTKGKRESNTSSVGGKGGVNVKKEPASNGTPSTAPDKNSSSSSRSYKKSGGSTRDSTANSKSQTSSSNNSSSLSTSSSNQTQHGSSKSNSKSSNSKNNQDGSNSSSSSMASIIKNNSPPILTPTILPPPPKIAKTETNTTSSSASDKGKGNNTSLGQSALICRIPLTKIPRKPPSMLSALSSLVGYIQPLTPTTATTPTDKTTSKKGKKHKKGVKEKEEEVNTIKGVAPASPADTPSITPSTDLQKLRLHYDSGGKTTTNNNTSDQSLNDIPAISFTARDRDDPMCSDSDRLSKSSSRKRSKKKTRSSSKKGKTTSGPDSISKIEDDSAIAFGEVSSNVAGYDSFTATRTPPESDVVQVQAPDSSLNSALLPSPAVPQQPIYYSYYERNTDHHEQYYSRDQDTYLEEAKRLKHRADNERVGTSQASTYLEAGLYFILTGISMERDRAVGINAAFTMYKDTLNLIRYIGNRFRNRDYSNAVEAKILVLSMKCQSMLSLKLFKIKMRETKEVVQYLTDHFNKAPSPFDIPINSPHLSTPSPHSPTSSPAGSSNLLPGHNPSPHHSAHPNHHHVPRSLYSQMYKQCTNTMNLINAHELWETADNMVEKYHIEDFFIAIDRQYGPLTLHNNLVDLVRYVKSSLQVLKKRADII